MTFRAKILSLTLLWGVIGYSALFAGFEWWIRVLLGVVAVCVTAHLLYLKTLRQTGSDRPRARAEG